MPKRPILMLSLVASLTVATLPSAAIGSTPPPTTSPDDAAQDARSRRQEIEAEMELLRRSDAELEAELGRLDGEIQTLQARTADAEAELRDLQARLVVLREELTVAEAQAAEQHDRLIERAVAAYVDPTPQLSIALLADAELEDVGRRRVLLDAVAKRDRSVLDERLAAEAALRATRTETEQAEGRAAELKAGTEADLAALQAKRARQREVAAALDARMADFRHEADALAAEESRLTALIARREAAAPTTTAPPSTTTSTTAAPTTTTTRPGSTTTQRSGTSSTTAPPPTTTTTRPPTTTTTRRAGVSLAWPTAGTVTSLFGPRWGRLHAGIDIGAPTGTAIVAADGGTVFFAGEMGGYGNLTLIDHGNGIVTAYAHQSGFAASEGGRVSRGQTIGYVGNTGHSTGPHLHFEVRVSGTAVDPMPYLR